MVVVKTCLRIFRRSTCRASRRSRKDKRFRSKSQRDRRASRPAIFKRCNELAHKNRSESRAPARLFFRPQNVKWRVRRESRSEVEHNADRFDVAIEQRRSSACAARSHSTPPRRPLKRYDRGSDPSEGRIGRTLPRTQKEDCMSGPQNPDAFEFEKVDLGDARKALDESLTPAVTVPKTKANWEGKRKAAA